MPFFFALGHVADFLKSKLHGYVTAQKREEIKKGNPREAEWTKPRIV